MRKKETKKRISSLGWFPFVKGNQGSPHERVRE